MLGQVGLEQFLEGLPKGALEWVRCHHTSGKGGLGLYAVYNPPEPGSAQGFGGDILSGY